MLRGYSIGVFPPVYDVDMIGKEIGLVLKANLYDYKQKFRVSKLFGDVVEFIPSNKLDSSLITVVGCLNPHKITNITTKDCTMVLFPTPEYTEGLTKVLNRLQGSVFTLENYVSLLESNYKTSLMLEKEFVKTDISNWLELLNKKSLMALRCSSLNLWEYTVDSIPNVLCNSTDYMIEFFKEVVVNGETYRANIGWYITEDEEDGQCIERLHTLASDTEIELSEGKCLRVNYNRKRFIKDLSLLTTVTKEELLILDSLGDSLIKNNLTTPEVVNVFSIMQ